MKTAEEQSALLHGGPFDPGVIWRGTASKGKSRRQQCLRLCHMDCMEKQIRIFRGPGAGDFAEESGILPLFFLLLPIMELWQLCFKKGPCLLGRPVLVGHVRNEKIGQFRKTRINESAVCIAPLAVFFIEGTVRLFAD